MKNRLRVALSFLSLFLTKTICFGFSQDIFQDNVSDGQTVAVINDNLKRLYQGKLDLRPGDAIPKKDAIYNLGSTDYQWNEAYIKDPIFTNSPWIDIRAYGAVCDGSTDDTAALQAAHDASSNGSAIFIPPSTSGCVINSTVTITKQISVFGSSSHGSLLISSTDRAMFDINTNSSDLYYIKMRHLEMVNSSSGTISVGIKISGSNGLKYSKFEDLSIRGFVYAISIVNTGATDWTWFDGLDIHGEPTSPSKEGIHRTAVGTGMIINNSVIVTDNYGVFVQGSNFGDYVISGNQFFQSTSIGFCIYLEALTPFTYHDNVTITGNHFDGDPTNEYIKLVHIRASKIQANTMSGRSLPINEDSTSTDNAIQVGYGVGEQWDKKIIINDTPSTNYSGFGLITPQGRVHIVPSTNNGVMFSNPVAISTGTAIHAINDTNSANVELEIRATTTHYTAGGVNITAGQFGFPAYADVDDNLTPSKAGNAVYNSTNAEVCLSTGTSSGSWVKMQDPATPCGS